MMVSSSLGIALKNRLRIRLIIKMINSILSFLRTILTENWLDSIKIIIKIEIDINIIKLRAINVIIVRRARKINLEIGFSLCISEVPVM